MEENIHDDKLDDYVRRSFEVYEENPSTDMWGRVEGDLLPTSEAPAPQLLFRRYGWQALAAAVILVLFSTLVCEHFYYEEKLRALSAKPAGEQEFSMKNKNAADETPAQMQTNQASPAGQSSPQRVVLSPSASPAGFNGQKIPLPDVLAENTKRGEIVAPAGLDAQKFPLPNMLGENTNRDESVPPAGPDSQKFPPRVVLSPSAPPAGFDAQELQLPNALSENTKRGETEPITSAQNAPKALDIAFILIPTMLIEGPNPDLPTLAKVFINPVREPSGWYLGLQTTQMLNFEKDRNPIARAGRPAFASVQEGSDISAIYWLKTGKKLDKHFSIESGIGYQKTSRTATHTPRFRFGDGTGPLGVRRTFHYDLSTYGGTAEVSLRMEQTTPLPPADDEPVTLNITTTEYAEMLRVPLLAGYRFGRGRWQGQMKAGFLGNFMLKNEVDISARVSQNARFQPVAGSDGYTVRLSQGKFFLGYWLSAGAEFKLNKHLSLVAESALVGDFPRRDDYSRRLPDRYLLGLNVGANYNF